MTVIIHGDDMSASRSYLQEFKKKQKNIIFLDAAKLTITDLVQNVEGSGLFEDTKTIAIEDLLTKFKKSDNKTLEILNFIVKNSNKATFILWESKEISKKDLALFKDAAIKNFKLPKNIFLLLDSLGRDNAKNLLNLFHKTVNYGVKEELILFMIQRQIRLLLSLSDPGNRSIDEMTRLAPWQMARLERQAKVFSTEKLKEIYKKLYEIEIGQKTGSLSLSLIQAIDFLLLEM